MIYAVGVVELKSIAKGIEATDAALKSAGIRLVSAHPACPGKYEMIFTGSVADVTAALDHVRGRYEPYIVDSSVMGRIDEAVIKALFGTQNGKREGSLGSVETYSAASAIKVADLAVKTSRVEIYDLRVSRGMGGKGIVLVTGEVGDVSAAVEAGAAYAEKNGMLHAKSVIAAPHAELWEQL
jgi:microcompartment protein CcmL/EutN